MLLNSSVKSQSADREPVPVQAEFNALFPSKFSLTQYVPSKTDFDGANYDSHKGK